MCLNSGSIGSHMMNDTLRGRLRTVYEVEAGWEMQLVQVRVEECGMRFFLEIAKFFYHRFKPIQN